jgi:uncharacterized membrane protein HdeD (DUF308 family)
MKQQEVNKLVQSFSKKIKNTWQIIFLAGVVPYGISLMHLFYQKPAPNVWLEGYLNNIDIISYIIAIGLAVVIFSLKRKYFSRKFSRVTVEKSLQENPRQEVEVLLKKVLNILRRKMTLIWILGFVLVLDGVIFYWLTFSDRNNMHIYFIIGVYSLLINYPRNDLFMDIPWYVSEGKKEFKNAEN